jgi:uncharacterized membrane protein
MYSLKKACRYYAAGLLSYLYPDTHRNPFSGWFQQADTEHKKRTKGVTMTTRKTAVLAGMMLCAATAMASVEPQGVTNMGNVRGGDVKAAHGIIETKCTKCHSGKVIDAAIFANKDMQKIQQEMEKKGAMLNANEREVLGIYWKQQNPLRKSK